MNTHYWLSALALSAGLVGCTPQSSSPEPSTPAPPPAAGEQNSNAAPSAPDAAKVPVAQRREAFVRSADAGLQTLSQELDRLGDKVRSLAGSVKSEAEQAFETSGLKRDRATAALDRVRTTADETWQEVKAGYEVAVQELSEAVADLREKLGG